MKKNGRTPQEEKRLDYERQHFSPGKNDKAFRKNWPRKKAMMERRLRRKVAGALSRRHRLQAEDFLSVVAALQREPIRKWTIFNLRERVRSKLAKRQSMIGARKRRRGILLDG